MQARLSLLAVWLMTLVYAIRIVAKYFGRKINRARHELNELYPGDYVKKHVAGIAIHIVALLTLCALFAIWFRAVKFTIIIDASLIPKNLVDISGWLNNITAYTRNRNSAYFIPFSPSLKIGIYGFVAVLSSLLHVYAAKKLLTHAYSWLYSNLDTISSYSFSRFIKKKVD